jgi:hypothetical protein
MGYGIFNTGDGNIGAHVYAWTLANPGRKRTIVRHTCDIPNCVNPKHLVNGTQVDNMADMDARGRRVNNPVRGEQHYRAKLTQAQVDEARQLYTGPKSPGPGRKQNSIADLAERYGVSSTAMRDILIGRRWK